MRRLRADIRRAIAVLLLTVFAVGGLAAPPLHRLQHRMLEARLKAATVDVCDHTGHGVGLEAAVPDAIDDDCLLCVRPLHVFGTPAAPAARHASDAVAVPSPEAPDAPPSALLSIRGPPRAA